MKLRTLSIGLSACVLLGILCFCMYIGPREDVLTMLLAPFAFLGMFGFPPIISMLISVRSKHHVSHILAATASLLYGVWFACCAYYCFVLHLSAFSGMGLFVGELFSLPILLPLWITAYIVDRRHKKTAQDAPAEPKLPAE